MSLWWNSRWAGEAERGHRMGDEDQRKGLRKRVQRGLALPGSCHPNGRSLRQSPFGSAWRRAVHCNAFNPRFMHHFLSASGPPGVRPMTRMRAKKGDPWAVDSFGAMWV